MARAEEEALRVIKAANVQVNYPDKSLFAQKTKAFDELFEQIPKHFN